MHLLQEQEAELVQLAGAAAEALRLEAEVVQVAP